MYRPGFGPGAPEQPRFPGFRGEGTACRGARGSRPPRHSLVVERVLLPELPQVLLLPLGQAAQQLPPAPPLPHAAATARPRGALHAALRHLVAPLSRCRAAGPRRARLPAPRGGARTRRFPVMPGQGVPPPAGGFSRTWGRRGCGSWMEAADRHVLCKPEVCRAPRSAIPELLALLRPGAPRKSAQDKGAVATVPRCGWVPRKYRCGGARKGFCLSLCSTLTTTGSYFIFSG